MAWGAIGFEGGLKLERLDGKLNGEKYVEIIKENLIDTGLLEDKIF